MRVMRQSSRESHRKSADFRWDLRLESGERLRWPVFETFSGRPDRGLLARGLSGRSLARRIMSYTVDRAIFSSATISRIDLPALCHVKTVARIAFVVSLRLEGIVLIIQAYSTILETLFYF